jgi:hypothetical protein
MTAQQQMSDDIKKWSAGKLVDWFTDSVMRYKLIGMSQQEAEAEVMTLLMITAAGTLATRTQASVLDLCAKFGQTIANIRRDEGIELNLGG